MITLNIPESEWEQIGENGDFRSRLLAGIHIGGTLHHLEAIEVHGAKQDTHCGCIDNRNGLLDVQHAADAQLREMFDRIANAHGPDGDYETVEIFGRQYALFLDPGC